ncbi:MAG: hypothetical protein IKE24_11475 [Clostridia bacterium]|nr:hypothetical protein [Clostridia bacterium]
MKMLPSLSSPNTTLAKAFLLPSARLTPLAVNDKIMAYSDAYLNSLAITDAFAKEQRFQPASETYTMIQSELQLFRDSTVAEIVTGNISVEDGLAAYKDAAESLNLAQALAEMNAQ